MCEPVKYSGSYVDAAEELAGLIGCGISAANVRQRIRENWKRICVLAHRVHDEENSEEGKIKRAIKNINALGPDGFRAVLNGTANYEIIADFKFLAGKVR